MARSWLQTSGMKEEKSLTRHLQMVCWLDPFPGLVGRLDGPLPIRHAPYFGVKVTVHGGLLWLDHYDRLFRCRRKYHTAV